MSRSEEKVRSFATRDRRPEPERNSPNLVFMKQQKAIPHNFSGLNCPLAAAEGQHSKKKKAHRKKSFGGIVSERVVYIKRSEFVLLI